jgi:hypothetical protein
MKFAVTVLAMLALVGCSREQRLPTAPGPPASPATPTPSSVASLWLMVIGDSGGCVVGATVQVIRGQRLGQSLTQIEPCGYWDYGGGIVLTDLTPAVELTLRASAPGYAVQENTFLPEPSSTPTRTVFITLSKI